MSILDTILEQNPDLDFLKADGFDEAIIGYSDNFREPTLVYSIDKCIDILMERDGMDYEEATEYFYYNVHGAYVGEQTPIFVYDNFD